MSIGSTIKRLRREKDITQEQLAEYLGITSRAVSQWECGRTAPDISQLPALCHIFDVSSDVLLGIDIEKTNEAIQSYLDKARNEEYQGNFESSAEILHEAIRKFPKSYPIMQRLANALVCVYSRKGIKEYEEVFTLCRHILAECTDSTTRYEAIETLAIAYDYAGKKDEMLKLTKEMPHVHFSYENFMIYRWEGDADFKQIQDYMSYLIYHSIEMVGLAALQQHDNKEFIYLREDRRSLWKLVVTLLEMLFPDGDYQYHAQLGINACEWLCTSYCHTKDFEDALYWLEKGVNFTIHMDTYHFETPHTSPILQGHCDGGWIMEAEGNNSQSMLDWLSDNKDTEILRSAPRYNDLLERLQKVAKKH